MSSIIQEFIQRLDRDIEDLQQIRRSLLELYPQYAPTKRIRKSLTTILSEKEAIPLITNMISVYGGTITKKQIREALPTSINKHSLHGIMSRNFKRVSQGIWSIKDIGD